FVSVSLRPPSPPAGACSWTPWPICPTASPSSSPRTLSCACNCSSCAAAPSGRAVHPPTAPFSCSWPAGLAYQVLTTGEPYQERILRTIDECRRAQLQQRPLAQLTALGYDVSLTPTMLPT